MTARAPLAIRGTWTALATPMLDAPGQPVDFERLSRRVDAQIAAGVDVLVPCGTTGESPTLSHEEHDQVVAAVVERAAGRVPVVAGTGSNSTREAVRLTRRAAEAGVDGVLVVVPYYNKPDQRMLEEHFLAVADSADVPVVLYNVPGRTGANLLPDTIARLARARRNVVAVKSAAGSVGRVSEILDVADVAVLSGDDALSVPMIAAGARGVISVASNAVPTLVQRAVSAALAGDFETATAVHRRLIRLYRLLFTEPNPVPVKAALQLLGEDSGAVRGPLLAATPATVAALKAELARLGALPTPAA